ncbi:unnamed protein product [Musa textilis]
MQEVITPTWSKSPIDLVAFGIVPPSPSFLSPTPLSSKGTTPRTACSDPWSCTLASTRSPSLTAILMESLLTLVLRSSLASALQPCLGTWSLPKHSPPPQPIS